MFYAGLIMLFLAGLGFTFSGLGLAPISSPMPSQPRFNRGQQVLGEQTNGQRAKVVKVVDGDTIEVEIGQLKQTVRLVGVDTPETVDPRRGVQCFGKEASNETKSILLEKDVVLVKDVSDKDRFSRLLRYVFLPLPEGGFLFVNDYLAREGFAQVLSVPPDVSYQERFLEAQTLAREGKKGLWGKCF